MTDTALPSLTAIGSDTLESPTRRALRRLFRRKGAVVGLIVIVAFILLALFAPLIVPYDPIATNWALVRKPASAAHWFGTDDLGRDVLARVIYGFRLSVLFGFSLTIVSSAVGIAAGAAPWEGALDNVATTAHVDSVSTPAQPGSSPLFNAIAGIKTTHVGQPLAGSQLDVLLSGGTAGSTGASGAAVALSQAARASGCRKRVSWPNPCRSSRPRRW